MCVCVNVCACVCKSVQFLPSRQSGEEERRGGGEKNKPPFFASAVCLHDGGSLLCKMSGLHTHTHTHTHTPHSSRMKSYLATSATSHLYIFHVSSIL